MDEDICAVGMVGTVECELEAVSSRIGAEVERAPVK